MTERPRLLWASAGLATIIMLTAMWRLQYGVDLTDEAYYATFPHRFLLGDTPYISDLNVRQNAGLLMTPLVWLWRQVSGGFEGLILLLRVAYLAMQLAVAATAYVSLKSRVPRHLALTLATVPLAFVFFAIPAPSYNTIPAAAITAALCCLLLWEQRGEGALAIACITLAAVAAFTHPALLAVSMATCASLPIFAPTCASNQFAWRALGVTVVMSMLAGAVFAGALGAEQLSRLAAAAAIYAGPPANMDRLTALPGRLVELTRGGPLLVALWCGLWITGRLPAVLSLAVVTSFTALAAAAHMHVTIVWLALGSLPLLWDHRGLEPEILAVASLSAAAGLTNAVFSTNGVTNAASGSVLAAILFFVGLARHWPYMKRPVHADIAITTLAAVVVAQLALWQWRSVYRDDPIRRLTARVVRGPYAGLLTTPEKADYVADMYRRVQKHAQGHGSMLVFNRAPGLHLMAPIPPAVPQTWTSGPNLPWVTHMRASLVAELTRTAHPVLVLQLFRIPETTSYWESWEYPPNDPILSAVLRRGPRVLDSTANARFLRIDDPR